VPEPTGQQNQQPAPPASGTPTHLQGSVMPPPPPPAYNQASLQGLSPEQLAGLDAFNRQQQYVGNQRYADGQAAVQRQLVEQTGLPLEQLVELARQHQAGQTAQQSELDRKLAEIDERERKATERETLARTTHESMLKVGALTNLGLTQTQAQAAVGMLNVQVPQGQELSPELALAAAEQLRQTFPQMFPAPQMQLDPTTGQPVLDPTTGQPVLVYPPAGQQPAPQAPPVPGQQPLTPPVPQGFQQVGPTPQFVQGQGWVVPGQPAPGTPLVPMPPSTHTGYGQPAAQGGQSAKDKAKSRFEQRHGDKKPTPGA
jgi:hypothetical protein